MTQDQNINAIKWIMGIVGTAIVALGVGWANHIEERLEKLESQQHIWIEKITRIEERQLTEIERGAAQTRLLEAIHKQLRSAP